MKFSITTNKAKIDLKVVHAFLSNSYWAKNIDIDTVARCIEHSLSFGVLDENGKTVGFGRWITDKTTFAYLSDVFILEAYRGQGLSKYLVGTMLEHEALQGLRKVMLTTKDAQGLYAKFGFEQLTQPEMIMQKVTPSPYG